jgi:uncharacterized membrane protein YhaH (DUF805 family)
MGFTEAIQSGFRNYVTFSGRAARSEYWWFYLFTVLVNFAGGFLDGLTGGVGLINLAVFLGLILPTIAMAVRRLHDKDRSGWWLFIGLVPLIGILLILYWFVTRGTPGPNRFGPDPLSNPGGGGGWAAPAPDTGRYAASSVPPVGRKP